MNIHFSFPRSLARLILALALVVVANGLLLPGGVRVAHASGPYVVNVGYDGTDSNLGDGVCYDGVGGCTLRAAIQQASADGGTTNITFADSLAGSTINLSGSYGKIIWAGSNIYLHGGGAITVSGEFMNDGQSMFQIQGDDNTVAFLTIKNSRWDGIQIGDFAGVGAGNRNRIYGTMLTGHTAAAIYVYGGGNGGGHDNSIELSLIGASSWAANACVSGEGNGGAGVRIDPGANSTLVWANRVVCSGRYGVEIAGAGGSPDQVQISGNEIGSNNASDLGNGWGGIYDGNSSNTYIYGNTVSGNSFEGIWLQSTAATIITANYIGVSRDGYAALPNDECGVLLSDGAHDNWIGGTSAGEGNTISGNGTSGVCINSGSHHNLVDGNYIGLDAVGTAAIPNGDTGVAVRASNDNSIGTSASGVHQYIAGNTLAGIYIEDSARTFIGQTNRIGVAGDDITPRGNGQEGILLNGAVNTSVMPIAVLHNGGAGIALVGSATQSNRVLTFEVNGNGGLAIDLGNDGHTANGTHTPPGPNDWLPYPVITAGTGSFVSGTACNNCYVYIYDASGNPIAAGGGGIFLTSAVADGSGNWAITLPFGVLATEVTTLACEAPCDPTSNSSEMSPLYGHRVYLPLVIR
jgi:parallel beta-helix repeat protein